MTLLRESYLYQLWMALCGLYDASVLHRLLAGLGAWCSGQIEGSAVLKPLCREGAMARAWPDSFLCRFLSFLVDLPARLLRRLYRALPVTFEDSFFARLAFEMGEETAIAQSWCICLLWIIPFSRWNNAYSLMAFTLLLVLFGLSWLLSGFVTRPVARTWQNQQQFLSDASHELKTPLTVILSSADLLKTSAQPEQRQYVDNISVESRRMKALVEDMLTLSRTESGRAAPFAPLDLSDLVTDAALRFEPVAFEAGHPLQYDIQNGASLSGDRQQLDQLLDILLDNAVKYAAKGAPIRLTLDISGKNAVLAVENPGDPIPPDKLPHIFDRFYRVDDARTGAGGFGLGLAIAQQIVRRHKGTITAASDARATRFTVTLPLRH